MKTQQPQKQIINTGATEVLRAIGFSALLLLPGLTLGCNSGSNRKGSAELLAKTESAVTASSGSDDPGINLQCAADRIQKAPAPFHWSFKKTVTPDTNADWEADITPDAIGGTLIDISGTREIHGSRSDQTSWNTAVLVLTGPLPASTFALVDNSSATVRTKTDEVNGENTVVYTIDTSRDSPAEASLIRTFLGPNGFVKGAAWVTHQGCPVKFVVDVEQHNRDGTAQKEHYELNLTRR